MKYHHWSVLRRPGLPSLAEAPFAPWLWASLRRVFPDAIAACLMPDHFHVLAPPSARSDIALARAVGRFAAVFEVGSAFRPLEAPSLVAPQKLATVVRYVALNPCRPTRRHGPLCADPLEWAWSTYRDVIGAIIDPWVDARRLANVLDDRRPDFVARLHGYVTRDSAVDVAGTPQAAAESTGPIARVPLARVIDAVAAATRRDPESACRACNARRLFVHTAHRYGWRDRTELATALECSTRTISRCTHDPVDETALQAVALCLGDERLRRFTSKSVPER